MHIKNLLDNGADVNDFAIELIMISSPEFCCEMEMKLARTTLYPNGLNGNAGKNIRRSKEGQRVVSLAVSRAKKGKTKDNSEGVCRQAQKMAEKSGDMRTQKQKDWDDKKSDYCKENAVQPPTLAFGSRLMNDGNEKRFIAPEDVDYHIQQGWVFGSHKPNKPCSEERKAKMRKPKSEEHRKNMKIAWVERRRKMEELKSTE